MQLAATRRLEHWAASWARRRQGTDPHTVVLKRRRIYILPTRFGTIFAVMVFAMLLGSLNYGASLGFMLTFLLAGLGVVLMHHCHNNLLGTELKFAGAHPVFAGERAEFRMAIGNEGSTPRFEIELTHYAHGAGPVDVAPGRDEILRITVPTQKRGWLALDRFAVVTRHPGGLFRAWTWVHMDAARCLVYPEPAPPGRALPPSTGAGLGGRPDHGDSDFAGLRSAAPGDPPQRIAWKAYARTDMLLLKQFAGGDREPCMLDWDALPGLDAETRLSQLARWCLDAAGESRSFGLRLPGTALPLGTGPQHLGVCLSALALFEAPGP
jgi:uncharacterized protein (DUF58 family)